MKRKPSDYRELKNHIRKHETVSEMELERRGHGAPGFDGSNDLYLRFVCSAAGVNMWKLHDRFDVDVVFSWHNPTDDTLRIGLRLHVEEE